MEKKNKSSRAPITCFTADAEFFAVVSKGTIGIWNTSNGNLAAQWEQQDDDSDVHYTCMALRFTEKKKIRRRNAHYCLLAIGTDDGQVLVVDVLTNEVIWKSTISQSGLTALSFANEVTSLYAVGSHEVVEIDSESGQLVKSLKTTKKPIHSASFCCDRKIICIFDGYLRLLSLDDGKELLKMKSNSGHEQLVAISDDAKAVITSGPEEMSIKVWNCDWDTKTLSPGPTIPIMHPASAIECKSDNGSADGFVILTVLESGLTYSGRFESSLQDKVELIHVKVEPDSSGVETPKRKRKSINAARLKSIEADKRLMVLTATGSVRSPQFNVSICEHRDNAAGISGYINEEEVLAQKDVAPTESFKDRETKKRAAAELDDVVGEVGDTGVETIENLPPVEDDPTEPTMGEKLERLSLLHAGKITSKGQQEAPPTEQPRADSVVVLLKQALRADDRALLLDCLYNRNEKVIANSIALLNPSDVLKLLQYLASITDSRGAVLVCALPWLRRLLLQHASGIMSQESSLTALNLLYQLIEARVATFRSAVKLSGALDLLFSGVIDEGEDDEVEPMEPIIYEDKDTDEEEEEEADSMETDGEENREDGSDGELDEIDAGDFEDMSD
ncbi:hypothetical protein MLD38_040619 [Melastoma candidum]|nr:hypothetical protein MLD38_040619 [Melastoma candidum]